MQKGCGGGLSCVYDMNRCVMIECDMVVWYGIGVCELIINWCDILTARLLGRAGVLGVEDYSEFLIFEEKSSIRVRPFAICIGRKYDHCVCFLFCIGGVGGEATSIWHNCTRDFSGKESAHVY